MTAILTATITLIQLYYLAGIIHQKTTLSNRNMPSNGDNEQQSGARPHTFFGMIKHRTYDAGSQKTICLLETRHGITFYVDDKPLDQPLSMLHTVSFNPTKEMVTYRGQEYPGATNAKLMPETAPRKAAPYFAGTIDRIEKSRPDRDPDKVFVIVKDIEYPYQPNFRTWQLEKDSPRPIVGRTYQISTHSVKVDKPNMPTKYYLRIDRLIPSAETLKDLHQNVVPAHLATKFESKFQIKLAIGAIHPDYKGPTFDMADLFVASDGCPIRHLPKKLQVTQVVQLAKLKYERQISQLTARRNVRRATGLEPDEELALQINQATDKARTLREIHLTPFSIIVNLIPHLSSFQLQDRLTVGKLHQWCSDFINSNHRISTAATSILYLLPTTHNINPDNFSLLHSQLHHREAEEHATSNNIHNFYLVTDMVHLPSSTPSRGSGRATTPAPSTTSTSLSLPATPTPPHNQTTSSPTRPSFSWIPTPQTPSKTSLLRPNQRKRRESPTLPSTTHLSSQHNTQNRPPSPNILTKSFKQPQQSQKQCNHTQPSSAT